MNPSLRNIVRAVVIGGCIAGVVDIFAACLIYSLDLGTMLRVVASGLLGKTAASGGFATTLLGFVLQVAMAVLIAAISFGVRRRLAFVKLHWALTGLVYGVVTFIVMNYVVMPLSGMGRIPHFNFQAFVENMGAMLVFGLIIAFFARTAQQAAPLATRKLD